MGDTSRSRCCILRCGVDGPGMAGAGWTASGRSMLLADLHGVSKSSGKRLVNDVGAVGRRERMSICSRF